MNPLKIIHSAVAKAASRALGQAGTVPAGFGHSMWGRVLESFTGAWQRGVVVDRDAALGHWAVFACITLIAADIGKLRLRLVEQDANGIWHETESPAFSPVLRKPNRWQTRQKLIEQWIVSKLKHGNAYILKERDKRGVVVRLYVLDPHRVLPLVAPDGSVFYQVGADYLSGVQADMPAVPASEIIHDTMVCLHHPLVGVSPLHACGLAATQGLKIQNNSAVFFDNMSRPSGVLTAPGEISDETAARLKAHWETNYAGGNIGKVAVLGDNLTYAAMTVNAVDSQLVEQLKMTAEMVCTTYHVPAFKVGAGTIPAGQKVGDLNQIYYTDCLQSLMESVEALLDEGLGLTEKIEGRTALLGTEFDLDDLLKMDAETKMKTATDGVKGGVYAPDEARRRFNLSPVPGGATPYLQQQNYSLAALAKRDASADPFATAPAPAPAPAAGDNEDDDAAPLDDGADDEADKLLAALNAKAPESLCVC